MTDDIFERVLEAYRRIPPQDLVDTRFFMSRLTFDTLCLNHGVADITSNHMPVTMVFGLPLYLDDELAIGEVKVVTENEMDRAIRRIAAEGRMINIVKPIYDFPSPIQPAIKPTLKSLINHWIRKVWKR